MDTARQDNNRCKKTNPKPKTKNKIIPSCRCLFDEAEQTFVRVYFSFLAATKKKKKEYQTYKQNCTTQDNHFYPRPEIRSLPLRIASTHAHVLTPGVLHARTLDNAQTLHPSTLPFLPCTSIACRTPRVPVKKPRGHHGNGVFCSGCWRLKIVKFQLFINVCIFIFCWPF